MPSRSKRILLVASEAETRALARESLEGVSAAVQEATGGREGLAMAERETPDLVIADMVLRDLTGLGFCRLLRESPTLARVPLLLLSSFTQEADRILAFEVGVDDFVAKPFYKRELASRVSAILRRSGSRAGGSGEPGREPEGGLRFDPERGRLEVRGRRVALTPKELDIVAFLLRNEGRVLSRERIVGEVWTRPPADPRVVDAHVKAIRRKLGEAADALQTVRGVGFRFAPADREASAGYRNAG